MKGFFVLVYCHFLLVPPVVMRASRTCVVASFMAGAAHTIASTVRVGVGAAAIIGPR